MEDRGIVNRPAAVPFASPSPAPAVAGIGSNIPVPASAVAAPSPAAAVTGIGNTVAASPSPTPAATTLNSYSPSDTDLQAMGMTRDQWSIIQTELSKMDFSNLQIGGFDANPARGGNLDKFKTFTAPLSNKGNPTARTAFVDNKFNVIEGQPVRLFDNKTGKVIYEGIGYEGAEKAIELAQNLTNDLGNKADWDIQTGQLKNAINSPYGVLEFGNEFKTVAHEKANKPIIGEVLDVLGDAALGFIIGGPIGAAIAAGASIAGVNVSDIAYPMIATAALGPAGFLGTMGAAALGSAVSSVVQGRSIEETLIRAGMTGLTAGVLDKTGIGSKISDAVGGVLKDIGFESQVGDIISGIGGSGGSSAAAAIGDEIIVTALANTTAAGIGGSLGSLTSQSIVDAAKQLYPDYVPSDATKNLLEKVDVSSPGLDELVITANPVTDALSGIAPIVPAAVVNQQPVEQRPAEKPPENQQVEEVIPETVVTAQQPTAPVAGLVNAAPIIQEATPTVEDDEIVLTAQTPTESVAGVGSLAGAIPGFVADNYGTYQPQEPITQTNPETGEEELIITAQNQPVLLPSVAEALINQTLPEFTQTPEIVEPEKSVGDYIKDAVRVVSAVSPLIPLATGGGGDGGTSGIGGGGPGLTYNPTVLTPTVTPESVLANGGKYPYNPFTYGRAGGDQETEYEFFTRALANPVTVPVRTGPPEVPAKKEGGEMHDDMVKHLVEYQKGGGHRGPGKVTGVGSGQEDLIPAWLSDGEYVWSAQDVADLGDGSTDEGVRRLDKMRQMVRKQAGRKDVKKIAKPQKGIDTMIKAVGGPV